MSIYNRLMEHAQKNFDYIELAECDRGLIGKDGNYVLVVYFEEWNELATAIYMTSDVYDKMLEDMGQSNSNLPIPLFALTYDYGCVLSRHAAIQHIQTDLPFVAHYHAEKISHVGNPNGDLVFLIDSFGSLDEYTVAVSSTFENAVEMIRKMPETDQAILTVRPMHINKLPESPVW